MAISNHKRVGKPLGLFAECLCSSVDGWGAEVREADATAKRRRACARMVSSALPGGATGMFTRPATPPADLRSANATRGEP